MITALLVEPVRAAFLAPATDASVPALRRDVTGRLADWHLDRSLIDDARLVVTEMLANALRHGNAEDLAVRLTLDADTLTIEVDDQYLYPPYPARQAALDDDILVEPDEDGRGVFLIEALADAWCCRIVKDNPARGVVGVKTVIAEFSVGPIL